MTREQAKSELMQLYGSLSEEKKMALDVLMAQADGDLISREAVIEAIYDMEILKYRIDLEKVIKELPSVPIPNKVGHWIMPQQDDGMSDPIYYQVRCSKCGFDLDPQTWHMELHQYDADKYCPNCGCAMVEPQERSE